MDVAVILATRDAPLPLLAAEGGRVHGRRGARRGTGGRISSENGSRTGWTQSWCLPMTVTPSWPHYDASRDPDGAGRIGRAGQRAARASWSWDQQVRHLLEALPRGDERRGSTFRRVNEAVEPTGTLSVVLVVHDMARELPRTLRSLSPRYQVGLAADDYEVIVVDNGSVEPVDPAMRRLVRRAAAPRADRPGAAVARPRRQPGPRSGRGRPGGARSSTEPAWPRLACWPARVGPPAWPTDR